MVRARHDAASSEYDVTIDLIDGFPVVRHNEKSVGLHHIPTRGLVKRYYRIACRWVAQKCIYVIVGVCSERRLTAIKELHEGESIESLSRLLATECCRQTKPESFSNSLTTVSPA